MRRLFVVALGLGFLSLALSAHEQPRPIEVLFLGDRGHHEPARRFRQLAPVLAARGIHLTYTERLADLNPRTLARYDGLMIYANITTISPTQEKALLEYVESGKGLIPVHSASYCFLNSPKYVDLVGAQFLRHDTGVFRTAVAEPNHPVMRGFGGFESWDETYVHHRHNTRNRTVLAYRIDGEHREPWTWVRTQGKGRVFYTAWGHDERTWGNPGFQNLIERGIRWAVGRDPGVVQPYRGWPKMTARRTNVKPFEYVKAKVPFYPSGKSWGTTGQPLDRMQKPLDPAESVKHMIVPQGFEVRLFASEEQIGGKPICMAWDERGRLWVAVTRDYPNELKPEGQGRDRILILEDTDGDGRADKVITFAEGLSIPTSLAFAHGGVIVNATPETLFLKDTDGDGKADVRRVLFRGWGTSDTHAVASNLHYGFDNWIYGIVGYSGFEGQIHGEPYHFGAGFYRFKPDGSRFEFLRSTNNNSWGVGLSEEGVVFGSTANGNPSVHLPILNRYYEAVRGWSSSVLGGIAGNAPIHPITDRVRQVDWHGHFTAAAGHALYTARSYPREYWDRTAFVCEPTGHLVALFQIQPRGSTFWSHDPGNLLASDDEWTAPIMAEVGPDGQVWVIDWYNYIVQHNPTPPGFRTGKGGAYETNLRDKTHGRIYRIVYKGAKATPPRSLAGASPAQLVATLRDSNLFWRLQAHRLLVERGKLDVLPALVALAQDKSVDAIGLNPGVIHALWTMQGLGVLDGTHPQATTVAIAALKHRSAGVRRNAVQVLPPVSASTQALLDAGLLHDPDPQVRLMSLLALADLPASESAAKAVLAVLDDEDNRADRWLMDAATCAAAHNAAGFLQTVARGATHSVAPKVRGLVQRVAEHYARGGPTESISRLLRVLAQARQPLATPILGGLAHGWPRGKNPARPGAIDQALISLLPKLAPEARGSLLTLAGRWGSRALEPYAKQIASGFLTQVQDDKATDARRLAAARQLIDLLPNNASAANEVLDALSPRNSPQLATGLLEAVGRSQSAAVGKAIVEHMPALTPAARSAAIRVLLARSSWTESLLAALEKRTIELGELSLDQKQALAAYPTRKLAERARKLLAQGGGLPSPDRQKVVEQMMFTTRQSGNAAAGHQVFTKTCAKCHMHDGEGARIGPDLSGMAVRRKEDLLIDILDPSRSVEGNFRQYLVTMKNGQILTGLLASENRTAVEILDADAKKHTLLRDDIDELQASNKSLMPEGFEKQLSANDLTNLLAFLTQRGKYLPLSLDKVATAVSTRGMFYDENSRIERLVFRDWSPKTFHGVPFHLVEPRGNRTPNVVLLYGPQGKLPPHMPHTVELPCNTPARAIHFLSGISGWGYPATPKGTVSLIVRLHYDDGKVEDHALKNGEEFADYIRRVDVPGSEFAFRLRGQQVRYLAVHPQRDRNIKDIELIKGPDGTAPIIMAVTVETR